MEFRKCSIEERIKILENMTFGNFNSWDCSSVFHKFFKQETENNDKVNLKYLMYLAFQYGWLAGVSDSRRKKKDIARMLEESTNART